jgi:hypothetical protein
MSPHLRSRAQDLGEKALPGVKGKARTMKHVKGTALTIIGLGICAALLAGKDDIRKFHRMRSM